VELKDNVELDIEGKLVTRRSLVAYDSNQRGQRKSVRPRKKNILWKNYVLWGFLYEWFCCLCDWV